METDIYKICALAILCGVVGGVLGKNVGGIGTALKVAGGAAVLGGLLGLMADAVSLVRTLDAEGVAEEYTELMLKGLGIAVLCRICSDVCRDCGENTVAAAVESAGKICMVILAVPAVSDVIALATELLEKID